MTQLQALTATPWWAVQVMPYPADRAKCNPSLAGQEFFLELWDVGAHPRYETMRELFYQGVNGVILVHDLSFRRWVPPGLSWAGLGCLAGLAARRRG